MYSFDQEKQMKKTNRARTSTDNEKKNERLITRNPQLLEAVERVRIFLHFQSLLLVFCKSKQLKEKLNYCSIDVRNVISGRIGQSRTIDQLFQPSTINWKH